MQKRLGKNDLIFLGAVLAAGVILLAVFFLRRPNEGAYVQITVDGTVCGNYPLSEDAVIEIRNQDGAVTNILKIEQGRAKMIEADCPDQLCMHQKAIFLGKENIVCLPNKVVVTVINEEETRLDAVAQ